MTEQMAIEYMENEVMCIEKARHCDRDCLKCELVKEERPLLESFATAIQALEEIQQCRAIGTVEELQALKEKSVAKKPRLIMNAMVCPSCPKVYSSDSVTYCTNCGQHLDWE